MDRNQANGRALQRGALALLVLLVGALACFEPAREDTPPQGWWDERGPVVPHDSFPADCSLCHDGDSWSAIRADFQYDHGAETGEYLDGAHARAECLRCHNDRGPVQLFSDRGCAGCHEDVHQGRLGPSCADCHDERDWRPNDVIAKHAGTRFPLVGSHAAVACWQCHPGAEVGNFAGTDPECLTCHGELLASTGAPGSSAPDHLAQGWTNSCDRCHIPTTWDGAGFNHVGFPLTGAHQAASCDACHTPGGFTGLPSDCIDCHSLEFTGAADHAALGYPTDCTVCHGTASWVGADFNHAGAGIFSGCVGCHLTEFTGTSDPDHAAMGLGTACEDCHSTNTWEPSTFAHGGISSGCATCHLVDYNQTTDPNHIAEGFSTTCEDCHHSFNTWEGAAFDHAGITSGCADCHLEEYTSSSDPDHAAMMLPTSCEDCHVTFRWTPSTFAHGGISSGCVACHQTDYNQSTSPNHLAEGYPTSCEDCHSSFQTWLGATFDHGGISTNCATCHLDDFNQTTSPNHTIAGFPISCEACHGTSTWFGATFNHNFPITAGDHKNLDCNDCHTVPSNYAQFSCIDCHEHNQADMADKHKLDEVPGYVWSTPACYACHPSGSD